MVTLPYTAERCQVLVERVVHAGYVAARETVVFSQSEWSRWTVQVEHRFMTVPEDLQVRRAMIISVDSNS
jgi:hypothetical protein